MYLKTILLTGASGFIGSHLAKYLCSENYKVIAIFRNGSDLWRFQEFENSNLVFVNINTKNFKEKIIKHKPSVVIHAAWQGVISKERNDWNIQIQNILFTTQLLILANEIGVKKIICFGSQAEYGKSYGRVNENTQCNPKSPYGVAKLAVLNILKPFSESNSINWFWIRLFSLYGTHEGNLWLIPSVINSCFNNKPMNLTKCEQRYDYLYVKDFANAIIKVLETDSESGVFNLSSNSSIQLKEIIEKIKYIVNPNAVFNFGKLSYDPDQVMHIESDSTKFNKQFNFKINSEFEQNIREIVKYYKNNFKIINL